MIKNCKVRNTYSKKFKLMAVKRHIEDGISYAKVSKEFGIHEQMIIKGVKKYRVIGKNALNEQRGNCYDNACIENFLGHLKSEQIHLNIYESKEDLEAAVHSYIYLYNNHRFQSKLKNPTPIKYRCTA